MRLDCRWNRSYLHRSRWGLVSLISLVGTVGVKRFVSIRPSLSPPYTTSRPLCLSFSLPPSSLIHLPAPTSNPLLLLQQGWVNWLLTAVKARICIRSGFCAILISHFIICKYPQCSVNLFILTWNDPECCRTPPHHHTQTQTHWSRDVCSSGGDSICCACARKWQRLCHFSSCCLSDWHNPLGDSK